MMAAMPVFMDIHEIQGATREAVAKAHLADLAHQASFGVEHIKYWFNEKQGKAFCLCRAPSSESVNLAHRKAHGLEAAKVIEVDTDIVEGFLGDGQVNPAGEVVHPGRQGKELDTGVRTVLFTDIVDSTALTQKLGDRASIDMLRVHDEIVRSALSLTRGRFIKHTGDGVMASFLEAAASIECARTIQCELARYRAGDNVYPIRVRIGGAVGEPVERNNDLFGSTVQLASRLCASAEPDQILVSDAVREQCSAIDFKEIGELALKGFDQPCRACLVPWRDD